MTMPLRAPYYSSRRQEMTSKNNIFDAKMREHILCALREKVRRQRERGKQDRDTFQKHGNLCQKIEIDGQTFLRILLPQWRALET